MNNKVQYFHPKIYILLPFLAILLSACQANKVEVAVIFNNAMCNKPKLGITKIEFSELANLRGSRLINLNKSTNETDDRDGNSQGNLHNEELSHLYSIYLGAQPTGGYSLALDRVDRTMDKFDILVDLIRPEPNSIVTQSITHPCLVIELTNLPTTAQLTLFADGEVFADTQSLPAL